MATDDDDDIWIPRRLHSTADGRDTNGTPAGCTIDPAMLERRSARKKGIGPQASNSTVDKAP